MENYTYSDELTHHGTKGMKWGRRLYQNKDGSLTPLGQKRYNKESARLKKEEDKLKAEKKVLANKQKTQAKFDRLDKRRQKLEQEKEALKAMKKKGKKGGADTDDVEVEETVEQKRDRLLKSTNPKEIYDNKDLLTYNEINDRINRIDLETKLYGRIPTDPTPEQKTFNSQMVKAKNTIDNMTGLYKSVDTAVSTVANSTIGKTVAKRLGIELPKKERESLDDFLKNISTKSAKEIQERSQIETNTDKLYEKQESRNKKAQKQAEERRRAQEVEQAKKDKEARDAEKLRKAQEEVDKYNGKYRYGKKGDDIIDAVWTEDTGRNYYDSPDVRGTAVSTVKRTNAYNTGRDYVDDLMEYSVAGYLEDRSRRR